MIPLMLAMIKVKKHICTLIYCQGMQRRKITLIGSWMSLSNYRLKIKENSYFQNKKDSVFAKSQQQIHHASNQIGIWKRQLHCKTKNVQKQKKRYEDLQRSTNSGGKEVLYLHESDIFWKHNFENLDRRVFASCFGLLNSSRNGVNKY